MSASAWSVRAWAALWGALPLRASLWSGQLCSVQPWWASLSSGQLCSALSSLAQWSLALLAQPS